MRQTNHSTVMHTIEIPPEKGLVIGKPAVTTREDIALPSKVTRKILKSRREAEQEIP